ncbi:hypothetical protein FRC01_000092 [Tulasnella sp. 417]|nr:hypothetical protein FRC01_000092 [Tulasnella sp. 417]
MGARLGSETLKANIVEQQYDTGISWGAASWFGHHGLNYLETPSRRNRREIPSDRLALLCQRGSIGWGFLLERGWGDIRVNRPPSPMMLAAVKARWLGDEKPFPNRITHEPLAAWRGAKGTIVIVMDALDECSPESGAEEILIRWAIELPEIPVSLKVLITSCPEFHIRTKFQALSLRTISQQYILHDIEKSVVREDIELFLRHHLNQIAEEHGIETPWPGTSTLSELIERAGVLFIFAATAVKVASEEIRQVVLPFCLRAAPLGEGPSTASLIPFTCGSLNTPCAPTMRMTTQMMSTHERPLELFWEQLSCFETRYLQNR